MHTSKTRQFQARPRDEEIALLRHDDESFRAAQEYLRPLIVQVLNRLDLGSADRARLVRQLLLDVPIAARRFLGSPRSMSASYKFSTYFTWYIHRRLEAEKQE